MQKPRMMILLVLVSTVAIVASAMTPALAKDSRNKKSIHSSAKTPVEAAGHAPEQRDALKVDHQDYTPSPAWKTIGGTVKTVRGDIYIVEDYEGNQVTLRVGQGTKHIDKKKVGDTVRAEITRAASRIPFSNPLHWISAPALVGDIHAMAGPVWAGPFISSHIISDP